HPSLEKRIAAIRAGAPEAAEKTSRRRPMERVIGRLAAAAVLVLTALPGTIGSASIPALLALLHPCAPSLAPLSAGGFGAAALGLRETHGLLPGIAIESAWLLAVAALIGLLALSLALDALKAPREPDRAGQAITFLLGGAALVSLVPLALVLLLDDVP